MQSVRTIQGFVCTPSMAPSACAFSKAPTLLATAPPARLKSSLAWPLQPFLAAPRCPVYSFDVMLRLVAFCPIPNLGQKSRIAIFGDKHANIHPGVNCVPEHISSSSSRYPSTGWWAIPPAPGVVKP